MRTRTMVIQRYIVGIIWGAALSCAGCSGAPKNNGVWDMYALPGGGTAPYDNDYYYRAPAPSGSELQRRCNSIGDMPSCGSD